jgi:hypothetical protein
MDTARRWWRRWRVVATWLVVDQALPGATLFALLLWLSYQYVRGGFGDVRQHAFAPDAGRWSLATPVRKNWWNCTCAGIGACVCLAAIARGMRRCCVKLLPPAMQLFPTG